MSALNWQLLPARTDYRPISALGLPYVFMEAVIFPDQLRGRPLLANLRSVQPLALAAEHSQPAVFGLNPSSRLFGFRPDSIYRPEAAVSRPLRLLH